MDLFAIAVVEPLPQNTVVVANEKNRSLNRSENVRLMPRRPGGQKAGLRKTQPRRESVAEYLERSDEHPPRQLLATTNRDDYQAHCEQTQRGRLRHNLRE